MTTPRREQLETLMPPLATRTLTRMELQRHVRLLIRICLEQEEAIEALNLMAQHHSHPPPLNLATFGGGRIQ